MLGQASTVKVTKDNTVIVNGNGTSEDICKDAEEIIQKVTDTYIRKIEEHLAFKEAEIMKV